VYQVIGGVGAGAAAGGTLAFTGFATGALALTGVVVLVAGLLLWRTANLRRVRSRLSEQ
jgi:hypothetical protein